MNTWISHTTDRDDKPVVENRVPIGTRLSESIERWIAIKEKYVKEFATETGGVPTKFHIARAEQLADREIRQSE